METPLLASDEGDTPPSLSNGPITEEESSSGLVFSLLGARHEETDQFEPVPSQNAEIVQEEEPGPRAFFTILSGALALLHVGFVWGSYLASSWSDTHIAISINWFSRNGADTIVRTTDLGSALSIFYQAHRYVMVAFLVVTCLVIPCLGMLSHPLRGGASLIQQSREFTCMELAMRFALGVVYVFSVLDLSTSFIELEWTDTRIELYNRWRGGLVSFVVGTSASMVLATVFRVRHCRALKRSRQRVPPASAFQFFHNSNGTAYTLVSDNAANQESNDQESNTGCTRKVLTWEFGLLAIILLVPTMTLPLMHVSYSGLAAQFMPQATKTIYLWQIPVLLWQHGMAAGTEFYMVAACVATSIAHVVLLPVLALVLGVGVWTKTNSSSERYKQALYCLYPNVNSITFAVALLLTAKSIQSVSSGLFDKDAYGLCQKFNDMIGETCLNVSATALWGAWFCLGQAVALELFITLTLWSFP